MVQAIWLRWAGAAMLSVLFITGCDHNKPSPATFQQALQQHFDQNPVCLSANLVKFPIDVVYDDHGVGAVYSGYGNIAMTGEAKLLATLKDAGLLTAQDGEKTATTGGIAPVTKMRKVTTYAAAPASGSFWQLKGNQQMLCYARVRVKSVDNYTEPAAALGQTASTVSFTYGLESIAPWTQNAELQKALPALKQIGGADRQDKAVLVLTHNGWMPATQ